MSEAEIVRSRRFSCEHRHRMLDVVLYFFQELGPQRTVDHPVID
jgi:hypothetical protein